MVLKAILNFLLGVVVKGFKSLFTINRDEEIGALKEANKNESEVLKDVQKADSARDRLNNDPDFAASVRKKYTRSDT